MSCEQSSTKLIACFALALLVCLHSASASAQKKPAAKKPKTTTTKPVDELGRLRDEYVKATNEYKLSLEKLRALYEKNVTKTEERLVQSNALFTQGLISKNELTVEEAAAAAAKDKVNEVNQRIANADTQIAQTLLEAEEEVKQSKIKIPKGGLVQSATMIRFNGGGGWSLNDAWKVQRFFMDSFKRQLPIAVFGQGAIHDRWRLDHRNSMDVSLHPDGPEGQSLLGFLRSNGIPFLAFRGAIPGTATGPHIHIGRPSHRY